MTKPGDSILILAGKGHNGDDSRCAREHLPDRRIQLLDVTHAENDFPKLDALLRSRPALIIDGLFGIGINRPLDASWVKFIGRINAEKLFVLAVDLPSGLNADSGEPPGAAIEAAVTALRSALEGDDVEAIKARTNDLTQAQMKLGEAMYKASQAAGPEASAAGGAQPKDDVIDADFREVDDDKKKSA